MFVRWSKWLVVLALIATIGGHWALLQSAAWVGMAVNFAQRESLSSAVQKTFDGQHPCKLCKLVKAGKASEKKRDLLELEVKLEFLTHAGMCGLFPPRPFRHFTPAAEHAEANEAAPLLPPPRPA